MEIVFLKRALQEKVYRQKSGNKTMQNRITRLLKAIIENPYEGIGKPEKLKGNYSGYYSGYYSRRITQEHRIVYRVVEVEEKIIVVSIRYHY